jgi:hypothetical protein
VRGKHKGFCILLLFALLIFSIGTSCTSRMTREDDSVEEIPLAADEETAQTAVKADEEEEVVDTDASASASSDEESESNTQKTTGILMSVGYLAMTIGMTILPLLMM